MKAVVPTHGNFEENKSLQMVRSLSGNGMTDVDVGQCQSCYVLPALKRFHAGQPGTSLIWSTDAKYSNTAWLNATGWSRLER